MAECDPQALVDEGRCFSCLTPRQRRLAKLALLCRFMGGECDVNEVAERASVTFSGLNTKQRKQVELELLCRIKG